MARLCFEAQRSRSRPPLPTADGLGPGKLFKEATSCGRQAAGERGRHASGSSKRLKKADAHEAGGRACLGACDMSTLPEAQLDEEHAPQIGIHTASHDADASEVSSNTRRRVVARLV